MKVINKGKLPILTAVILASCNSSTSSPAISETHIMETAISIVETAAVYTQAAIPTSTLAPLLSTPVSPTPIPPPPTASFSFPIDRHDPESVIRAWLDALSREDGIAIASIEGLGFVNYAFDGHIDAINVLEIKPASSLYLLEDQRMYRVVFEMQVEKGKETDSFHSGQEAWFFTVTWDANRDSWFVTNHGER